MTCGIYKLTFKSGKFYIGQSVDIEQRWKQHAEKFRKGTAAKNMQEEYNRSGFPDAIVLMECHKDHLDMMESMYINSMRINGRFKMLNTSIPKDYTDAEIAVIYNNEEYLQYSIIQLISQLKTAKENISTLEMELEELQDRGIKPPKYAKNLEIENLQLSSQVQQLITINQELSRRANMTWLERLLS